ncbi:MAG: branched-chain amino acid ABC transporter permease [Acetobacteraceae bacterium]
MPNVPNEDAGTVLAARRSLWAGRRLDASYAGWLVLVAILSAWPAIVGASFLLYVSTLVMLYGIGAMGLHLMFRVGQVSFGQAAFLGIGGYACALLLTGTALPWPVAVLVAIGASGLCGAVIGPAILRLRGVYFVLFTFILGEFFERVFDDWTAVTDGAAGISGIPRLMPFDSPTRFYYLCFGAALLCAAICERLLRSDFGEAVDAVRTSENLAASNGIPVSQIKVTVFALACGFAGLQGALQACFVHYISPVSYTFSESLRLVVMNVIGGMNALPGAMLGAAAIVALPELLRSWVQYQWVFYGAALILVVRYAPGGLYELAMRAKAALRKI